MHISPIPVLDPSIFQNSAGWNISWDSTDQEYDTKDVFTPQTISGSRVGSVDQYWEEIHAEIYKTHTPEQHSVEQAVDNISTYSGGSMDMTRMVSDLATTVKRYRNIIETMNSIMQSLYSSMDRFLPDTISNNIVDQDTMSRLDSLCSDL